MMPKVPPPSAPCSGRPSTTPSPISRRRRSPSPLRLTGHPGLERLVTAALAMLTPPPELTVSQWADTNRRLSSEASAEPGPWSTARAEYQRGIMDAISDSGVETVVVMSSAQVGKALAIDTPIPTPGGWTTMGEVRVGDVIFDETGALCRVTAATGEMLGRTCYRVRFSDGSSIVADADHLWAVESDTEVRASRAMGDLFLDDPPHGPDNEGDR